MPAMPPVTRLPGLITYSGWGGTAASALTLYFTAAVTVFGGPAFFTNTASVSLDAGASFTNVFSVTGDLASAAYTYSIPSGQDLSAVQVRFSSNSNVPATGGDNSSNASITVSGLKIAP
jgi:hypothetical protein